MEAGGGRRRIGRVKGKEEVRGGRGKQKGGGWRQGGEGK